MELDFVLDSTGFPMIRVPTTSFYIHWMPVTKVQIEHFLTSVKDATFDSVWYSELLALNPRVTVGNINNRNYWNAITTGILPREARSYAAWCGPEYDMPTAEEWYFAFQLFNDLPQPTTTLIEHVASLEGINFRAGLLVKKLGKSLVSAKHFDEVIAIADQMMMRFGVMEYVYEDNQRNTFVGYGETNRSFFASLYSSSMGAPQRLVDPYGGARIAHYGFRLIKRVSDEDTLVTDPKAVTEISSLDANSIFISYKRMDWEKYVEPLIERLQSAGIAVWVDQHLIDGGDDWFDEINKALKICKRMILCVSPEALESRHVKIEYRYFFNNHKKLFPLICREADLPAELQAIQYYKFSQLDRLIRTLKQQI
ncbi:MAG: TIR domain-containing protein [Anaerolineae bacterium]|nr:TIR domain-containing protein [Anaerolineae bacterium]